MTVLQLDDPVAERQRNRMRPVRGPELAHTRLRMRVNRSLRDTQNLGDLPSRFSFGDPKENLDLPRRKLGLDRRSSAQ